MHPVLFEVGGVSIYSYGAMIALGALGGVLYMAWQGRRELGLTFDHANTLFLLLFIAAFVGGKLLLFLEEPAYYLSQPGKLLMGRGFVFYGSFLLAIPTMLWYFKRIKIPTYAMLDIMAVTTCIVHLCGRVGCFLAGCCYGKPTDSFLGVVYSDPLCYADPLHTALIPTQLIEALFIGLVMIALLSWRTKRSFYGQLFLLYLMCYATGRFVLEYFRGDGKRGFVIEDILSHSQFIALCMFAAALFFYRQLRIRNAIALNKKAV